MTFTETEKLIRWLNNQTLANLSNNLSLECEGEEKELLAEYRVLLANRLDDILNKIACRKSIHDNEKYISIFNELREWMNKRHLDYKSQLANIVGNVLEEITEIARAKDDIHEKVDGLVDICVFCINASEKPIDICRFNGFEGMTLNSTSQFIDFTNCVMNNIEFPQEIVPICFAVIENLGYNPYECMLEVCKELHSRKQDPTQKAKWDNGIDTNEKWQKWKEQPKETLYKADYSKCKLKEGKE